MKLTAYFAELIGTAGLLCAVVGSGIMAEQLAMGNVAIALLANTLATVFALYVLIEIFAPLSGAHFNPAVSLIMTIKRELTVSEFSGYVLAQLAGAMLGVWLAHLMFNLSILEVSTKTRTGLGQWVAEVVATAGLLFVILRVPAAKVSVLVACYIGAAYWFTSSTSFANPAAVLGRMLSNTFAGIAPSDALAFVFAQFIGALLAYWVNAFVLVTPPSPSSPSNS
jgi:glycerol uptake facilitator-like aquaporin